MVPMCYGGVAGYGTHVLEWSGYGTHVHACVGLE